MLNEVFVGFSTTAGAGGLRSPIAYNLSMRYRHSMRGRRLFAGLLSAAMVWFSASVGVDAERQMDDEEFVRLLAVAEADKAVDRKRLSRLFFSIASTLNAGKNNVRLLQARLSFRDPSQEGVRDLSESRYDAYVANLVGFQSSGGRLLDEPGSDLVFYAAMMDGLQACWALDRYSRVVETYGATSEDLLTVLPSLEHPGLSARTMLLTSNRLRNMCAFIAPPRGFRRQNGHKNDGARMCRLPQKPPAKFSPCGALRSSRCHGSEVMPGLS